MQERDDTPTLLTFDTTHHALWAEEVARDAGIPCEVVPAPPAARARCNLALEVLPESLPAARAALQAAGVPFGVYAGEPESGAGWGGDEGTG